MLPQIASFLSPAVAGSRVPARRSLTLAADLNEVGRCRCLVGDVALEACFPEPRRFDIQLASSEACANAIEHSPRGTDVTVDILLYPDRLEIHVRGRGAFAVPSLSDERLNRGFGLPLMVALSDQLAISSGPDGGTVTQLTFRRARAVHTLAELRTRPNVLQVFGARLRAARGCATRS